MELVEYFTVLRRRWLFVVLIVAACGAGALGATRLQTKTYDTETRLIVNAVQGVPRTGGVSGSQLAAERALSFAQIATTGPGVAAAAAEAERQDGPFANGAVPRVSAEASGTDPFVMIEVKDSDPRQAQAVADAYVTILPTVAVQLDQATHASRTALATVDAAGLPNSPSSPRPTRNLLVGLALGVILGLGLATLREAFDRRLRSVEEVERVAGVSLLGAVPFEHSRACTPVISHPMSRRAEAYRTVRTNLMFATADGMPRSVLITSALEGEGKSTLAANLALACGRTGQRVVLIDADFRRPMLAQYLDVVASEGLTELVANAAPADSALIPVDSGRVDMMSSGPMPLNPSELLGSARMADLLRELGSSHDVIIIDAAPVLAVADALVLAANVEAVVLVARVGKTNDDTLARARDAVLKVNANLVGVVANAAAQQVNRAYGYSYRRQSRLSSGAPRLRSRRARRPEFSVEPTKPAVVVNHSSERAYEYFSSFRKKRVPENQ